MLPKKELRKFLKELSKEQLEKEVENLFTKFQNVQQYYSLELGEDSTTLLKEYKKKLEKVFYPKRYYINPSMAEANKIINEFSKISVHIIDTIDLMIYKIELTIKLFEEWGHEFSGVMNSFTSTYDKVIELIHKNNLIKDFRSRCERIEEYGMNFYLINKAL